MKSLLTAMMFISTVVLKGGKYDDSSSINMACSNTPNYSLCVSVLCSDPRTGGGEWSNLETLGVVMVDAVKAKAEEMIECIHELEKSKPVEWRLPLSQCYIYYYAVVHADVAVAQAGIKRGNPKFAVDGMADAIVEAESCQVAFQQNSQILDYLGSPISDINNHLIQLSAVASSIIRMLL